MRSYFGKAAACAGMLTLAGSAFAFLSEVNGYSGPVTPSSGIGVVGRVTDLGTSLQSSPVAGPSGVAYFAARPSPGNYEIVALRAGSPGSAPQVSDREPVPFITSSSCLAWDAGELIVVTPTTIATIAATDTLGTPMVQTATVESPRRLWWSASREQLLVMGEKKLQSWQRVAGTFVLRGTLDLGGEGYTSSALYVDETTHTIYVGVTWSNGGIPMIGGIRIAYLRTYQWDPAAAQPVVGGSTSANGAGPGGLALAPDGSGRLITTIWGRIALAYTAPFPAAPTIGASANYDIPRDLVVGPSGILFGRLAYGNLAPSGVLDTTSSFTSLSPGVGDNGYTVFASDTEAFLAPFPDSGQPQSIYQLSTAPGYSANFLHGIPLQVSDNLYATAITLQSQLNEGNVSVAVYTTPTTTAPYELQWAGESVSISATGPVTIPFGGRLIERPALGKVMAMVWTDRAGLLAEVPSGAGTQYEGFRLISPGGTMPATISQPDLLQRAGSVAAQVTGESPATLVYAEVAYDGISQGPQVTVAAPGDFVNLEISETADFAVSSTLPHNSFNEYPYTIHNFRNGSIPLYVRARGIHQIGGTLVATVQGDTVPPIAEPPVAESHYALNGINNILWRLPEDPAPSTGLKQTQLEVVREDPAAPPVVVEALSATLATTYTLVLGEGVPGGVLRARLRGVDRATNVGEWAVSEPFEVNAIPAKPVITLSPEVPTSADYITMSTVATDPDVSDTIASYKNYYVRTSPLVPTHSVFSDTLTPEQTARYETWQAFSYATDNHGAKGWSATKAFTIANGKPSQPLVEIRPRVPAAGQEMIVYVLTDSVDPDGDDIAYDFRWYVSRDGGATWTRKTELNGSSQVSGLYVEEGELWKVEHQTREVPAPKSQKAEALQSEIAWDIVRVGNDNTPPVLNALQPLAVAGPNGTRHVRAAWSTYDAQGGPVTVEISLTAPGAPSLIAVTNGPIDGATGSYEFDLPATPGRTYSLLLVARDNRGAITQVITRPIAEQEVSAVGWMLQ